MAKKKSKRSYTPLPFNRFHSDKVRENKKEARRIAKKEAKDE